MSTKVIVLVLAAGLLALLVCGGAGAFWYFKYGVGAAGVGPLAGAALVLPQDAALLAGFDAKAFTSSAGYKQITTGDIPGLGQAMSAEEAEKTKKEIREGVEKGLKEAEDKVGIRLDRDLDRIVVAVSKVGDEKPEFAALATGRFDRNKIGKALEATLKAEGETMTAKTVEGVTVQELSQKGKPGGALAFLDDATLVVGQPGAVEAVVANHAKKVRALETNQGLLALVKGLDPGSGYWIVVDQPLIARIQKESGGAQPQFPVPRTATLAGKFDGGLELAAEMADDAAAKNVADLIQGGLGVARMQAAQNPEIQKVPGAKELLDGIKVTAAGKKVTLTLTGPAGGGTAMAGVVAAIAIPSLLRARVSANEAATIGDIRSISSAQAAYSSVTNGEYGELGCLAEPKGCIEGYSATAPTFLDSTLANAKEKNGYKRAFHPGPAGSSPRSHTAYAYTATPLKQGQTGIRSFCGDQSGRICFDATGAEIVPQDGECPTTCSDLR